MSSESVIGDALEKGGGVGAVAKALGISDEAVRLWRARGKVPAERVVDVERLTGVPRERLRPDLYRKPDDAEEAVA
ncbi:MAG: Cro/CI family transcriptional regulator [Sinimarinibacterium sp.]|jgi:DNA-binding transcriptional regulator YdaS (Cro superfamily)